jgi:excisionase family DNA binding protein
MSAPTLFLSRKQAAEACGVSTDTIARAVKAGHLRAKKTAARGGKELYRVADLEAWFDGLEDA